MKRRRSGRALKKRYGRAFPLALIGLAKLKAAGPVLVKLASPIVKVAEDVVAYVAGHKSKKKHGRVRARKS